MMRRAATVGPMQFVALMLRWHNDLIVGPTNLAYNEISKAKQTYAGHRTRLKARLYLSGKCGHLPAVPPKSPPSQVLACVSRESANWLAADHFLNFSSVRAAGSGAFGGTIFSRLWSSVCGVFAVELGRPSCSHASQYEVAHMVQK
jgi:hypothetical protein